MYLGFRVVAFLVAIQVSLAACYGAQQVGEELTDLGITLFKQGRYKEAAREIADAYIAQVKVGQNGMRIVRRLEELAASYDREGQYAKEAPVLEASLIIEEKALGQAHPGISAGLNNVGLLYKRLGRYPEAEKMYKKALAISIKVHGMNHKSVANNLDNLSLLYQAMGNYELAQQTSVAALSIYQKICLPDDPDRLLNSNSAAGIFKDLGNYDMAEKLYKRVLASFDKLYGPNSSKVATVLGNLGNVYADQKKLVEAEQMYRKAIDIEEKTLPPEHPDLAVDLHNLAAMYFLEGKYQEAEPLFRRALRSFERSLGSGSLKVMECKAEYALVLDKIKNGSTQDDTSTPSTAPVQVPVVISEKNKDEPKSSNDKECTSLGQGLDEEYLSSVERQILRQLHLPRDVPVTIIFKIGHGGEAFDCQLDKNLSNEASQSGKEAIDCLLRSAPFRPLPAQDRQYVWVSVRFDKTLSTGIKAVFLQLGP